MDISIFEDGNFNALFDFLEEQFKIVNKNEQCTPEEWVSYVQNEALKYYNVLVSDLKKNAPENFFQAYKKTTTEMVNCISVFENLERCLNLFKLLYIDELK